MILVTGGGFLGRAVIAQLLSQERPVRVFARSENADLQAAGVEVVRGDIRNLEQVSAALRGCEAVIHTAALAGIWGQESDYHAINVVGTENVLASCRANNVTRLVFTSSPSVTFAGTPQSGVDENVPYPTKWLAPYPKSKAAAEQLVLAAHHSRNNDGSELLTCALRPHLIWGPGDPHLVPRLIERAKTGQLRRVGDGKNLIDMIYVDNAAEAHLQALDALQPNSAVGGRAYFLSQGEPVNCWQWINDLLALVKVPPVERGLSLGAAQMIGGVLETVHRLFRLSGEPRMTRFLAAQLGMDHYFDISAARRDFGFNPRVTTAEGMQLLGEWPNQQGRTIFAL